MQGTPSTQNRVSLSDYNFTLLIENRIINFRGTWSLRERETVGRPIAANFDLIIHLRNRNFLIHPDEHTVMKEILNDLKSDQHH